MKKIIRTETKTLRKCSIMGLVIQNKNEFNERQFFVLKPIFRCNMKLLESGSLVGLDSQCDNFAVLRDWSLIIGREELQNGNIGLKLVVPPLKTAG